MAEAECHPEDYGELDDIVSHTRGALPYSLHPPTPASDAHACLPAQADLTTLLAVVARFVAC